MRKHGPQPSTLNDERLKRYSFFLYPQDVKKLDSMAKRLDIGRSGLLRDILHLLDQPRILIRYLTITDENLNRR